MMTSRFQCSCWAATYAGVIALATVVKTAMDTFPDVAFVQGHSEMYEPETQVYHIPIDVMIWHQE
jgi:hypothetical protein